jgi:hypothetical protein
MCRAPAPRQRRRYGLSRPGAAPTARLPQIAERGERSSRSPPPCGGHPLSRRCRCACPVHSPRGRRSTRNSPSELGHSLSRQWPRPGGFIFRERRAEQSKPTALPAHSLAARPGTLSGSLSMKHRVPFPGFEPGRHPPEGCGSASWPRRARTASGEPARRIELRPPPYRGGVLPLSLNRRELGAQASNLEALGSKPSGSADSPTAHQEPPSGATPDWPFLQGTPGRWSQGRSTLCGSRTRINLALNQVRLPDCGTSAWSLWTDSNGLLRVTTPVLCPVSYRGMAAHRGFEPRLPASESGVLPIERMGIGCGRCDSNEHATRFELARSAGCHHSRMVRREGLEPPAIGLRVHCSSI